MPISTPCLIIGSGPCGLFQVFELGLLGINAHVVETLPSIGGQCAELYPDKPIYDIPALPICGAQELVDRLREQISPFDPVFHLDQRVMEVEKREDGRFKVVTSTGTEFDAGTVVIAAGAGSFEPQRVKLTGIDECEKYSMWYRVRDPKIHVNKDIVILGGGDSALDWALELRDKVKSMTLIHRSQRFRAAPDSVNKMQSLCEQGKMRFFQGHLKSFTTEEQNGHPEKIRSIIVDEISQGEIVLELDHLLVFYGLSPKLGPILNWGLEIERHNIPVDTEKFQTSIEGIFAVGDINTYPGKKKLILSGFHEGALAAFAIKKHLFPDERILLQYTTTSSVVHDRLGVAAV